MYRLRMEKLTAILTGAGMRLAAKPQAGFFSLWLTPNFAYGEKIKTAAEFNAIMIKNAGIVGVHFEPYIRYATCAPLEDSAFLAAITNGFAKAKISY
jgi:hypothetical protein